MSPPSHEPSADRPARVLPFQPRREGREFSIGPLALVLLAEASLPSAVIAECLQRESRVEEEVRHAE